MGKLISIIETSRRLGLTRQTICNWINNGHLNAKSIAGMKYIDEDTILALQDTMVDIERQRMALKKLREEQLEEIRYREHQPLEEKTRKRYLNFLTGSAFRIGFFESMVHLMLVNGNLNEREAEILTKYLNGYTLEYIKDEYGYSRERVRQIVAKAIRKSQNLTNIEERIEKVNSLQAHNEILRKENRELRAALGKKQVASEMTDEDKALIELLSTKIVECDLSVRAINALQAGLCNNRFSFDKNSNKGVIIPPCKTLGDVCRLQKVDVLKLRNMGMKTLKEIEGYLKERGLSFGMDIDGIYNKINI